MPGASTQGRNAEPSAADTGSSGGFLARVDRLPGPTVGWVLGIPVAAYAVATGAGWVAGVRPPGVLETAFLVPAVVLAYLIVAVYLLGTVARSSFERFRPALDPSSRADSTLEGSLVGVPQLPTLVTIAVFEIVITGSYLTSPAATATVPDAPLDAAFTWGLWIAAVAAFGLLVVFSIQQLRGVSRLHRLAARVDPFSPDPINAFSRLTLTNAIVLIPLIGFAAFSENPWLQVPLIACLVVAAFVLPLRGMHDRLDQEKRRLLAGSNERLERLRARIHAVVDSDDLGQIGQLNTALSTVLAERDVIQRLPTWPWSTSVLRAFATAILTPVVIGVAFRLIDRFF